MIISRTPLRVSLFGGTTDFPRWYKGRRGLVLGGGIDKYVYVIVNHRFWGGVRVSYSKTEEVTDFTELEHELIREAMRRTEVKQNVEIITVADVPGHGTGLGSSSAVTVGALNALYAYSGRYVSPNELARQACEIELHILGRPIGKQDQYLCAHGGFTRVDFHGDGKVEARPVDVPRSRLVELQTMLMLFYIGTARQAGSILQEQNGSTEANADDLEAIYRIAKTAAEALRLGGVWDIGSLLHRSWCKKRDLAQGITNPTIDGWYDAACDAGAIGGKVCGAGGGGFLLLFVGPKKQDAVREALSDLDEKQFEFVQHGSQIIFAGDRG